MSQPISSSTPAAVTPAASTTTTFDTRAAYDLLLPEIDQTSEDDLLQVNRDIPFVTALILRAIPKLQAQRPLLEATFKKFDFTRLDNLQSMALAAQYADAGATAGGVVADELPAAYAAAVKSHRLLSVALASVIENGIVPDRARTELSGATGYATTAADVLRMYQYIDTTWEKGSKAKSGLTREELEKNRATRDELVAHIARREKAEADLALGGLRRKQAFTLMVNAYEYVRAALTFAFLQEGTGSVEAIAPSAYTMQKVTKRGAKGEGESKKSPSEPPAPPVPMAQQKDEEENAPVEMLSGMTTPFATLVNSPVHHDDPLPPRLRKPCPLPTSPSAAVVRSTAAIPLLTCCSRITSSPTASSSA